MGAEAADQTPTARVQWRESYRLIPSRFPPVGILDQISTPDDLEIITELEGWTNDRISNELGILFRIPQEEWVFGPGATVVMAAFCHPRPEGARFNSGERGAWYAAHELETAHAEVIYHRTQELLEVGTLEQRVQVRLYMATFNEIFHDLRGSGFEPYLDPDSYAASQQLAEKLFSADSNGIVYPSVRNADGTCLVCFRPKLIRNVRQGAHYEYQWNGTPNPQIRRLSAAEGA